MNGMIVPRTEEEIEGAVFEAALGLEPEDREIFLARWFRDDREGLQRITKLLYSHREASSFFIEAREIRAEVAGEVLDQMTEGVAPPFVAPQASAEGPGGIIGPYRIIDRIGEGGCGIVYEAHQEQPLKRKVAIKVIRLGMDTENVIARFEMERQALARMDHQNIARVLDAGATEQGRPYFVMELVEGEKITSYCDRQNLKNSDRLSLFIQVCHAIQHAHQKGVIHRDIKPSNILVAENNGVPSPKVIDFGIAKATDSRANGHFTLTSSDQFVGTPAYMSPEQIDMAGVDVDTRSDVYSLGVLLFELLTSRTPFDPEKLANSGMAEMRRTLLYADHPLPSKLLTTTPREGLMEIAAFRHVDPSRLISSVRGDLDWIVMKAMEKDRNRRYQTVNALASDVQRYLGDLPVTARPPGKIYLTGKFIRRNRVAFASAVAVLSSLVIGLGAATSLYLREKDALSEQERLGKEAEAARGEESRLRLQAQARANVSKVVLLLNEGKIREADALLQETPLLSIEPSQEAATVFRALGSWNATYGRWNQAVNCFVLLNQANRFEQPVKILNGSDLLATAPALLEGNDIAAYETFRKEALERYLPVETSLQAEHLLKPLLLLPIDMESLRRLKPAADLCERSLWVDLERSTFPPWEALALGLFRYRSGDFKGTIESCDEGLSHRHKNACRDSINCLKAMACHRMGQKAKATEFYEMALAGHHKSPDSGFAESRPSNPEWFDASVTSILLKEAKDTLSEN